MPTRDMSNWQTSICQVISTEEHEDIVIRGQSLDEMIGRLSFSAMMFVMLQGREPTDAETRVLDALMVASMEHGIAPPSMIARCFASYGTNIQAAMAGGILAFGSAGQIVYPAIFGFGYWLGGYGAAYVAIALPAAAVGAVLALRRR